MLALSVPFYGSRNLVNAVPTVIGLAAREVALLGSFSFDDSDWDNVDVMDYTRQSKHVDSRRSGTFLVEGQAGGAIVNGRSRSPSNLDGHS